VLFSFSWIFLGLNLNTLSKNQWSGAVDWISVSAPLGLLIFSSTQLAALTVVDAM
jgi:hypothetical protein